VWSEGCGLSSFLYPESGMNLLLSSGREISRREVIGSAVIVQRSNRQDHLQCRPLQKG
jgi:hypothetical protein